MTVVGWCPGSRTIDEMAELYPGTSAVRVFFGPGEGLPASAWSDPARVGRQRLVDLPENCTAIVSFKDQGADRAAFVEAWLKYRPDVGLDLITHHEPEQQDGGDPTPAQYRASWTRTREQVGDHQARAAGRLRLATCWTLQWIRRGGDWRQWFPEHEADAVDLLLFDWYPFMPGEPNPYRPRVYEDPAAALKVPVGIAAQLGKPWGLAEIDHPRILRANGYAVDLDPDGTLCASWYRATYAAAKGAGCQVWAHFHQNAGAALGDLTKRPAEQQALRDLIEQEASMAWSKGQPWRVVRSLDRLNTQIRAAYPRAVPPATPAASWGAIADSAHSSTSDHYPHYYSALGKTAVVCARDFPHAPGLGLDAHALADRLRASRDSRIGYVISNGRITGPSHGWRWDPYSGSDPHDTHIHVSTTHVAAADDARDWQIGEDDIMATLDELRTVVRQELTGLRSAVDYIDGRVEGMAYGRTQVRTGLKGAGQPVAVVQMVKALADALGKVDGQVAAQLADDFARIEQAVAEVPQLDPKAIADAIPAELARQVADELAARLAS